MWNLNLNASKCVAMSFSKIEQVADLYTINNIQLPTSRTHRDLRITICSNQAGLHYNRISSKAYHTLHLIRRIFSQSAPFKSRNVCGNKRNNSEKSHLKD